MKRILLQVKRYSILLGLFLIFTNCGAANDPVKNEVQKAYHEWCSAIGTAKGDANKVIKFYAPNALLLPTLSPKILVNKHDGLHAYFTKLTSNPDMKCTTNRLITNL